MTFKHSLGQGGLLQRSMDYMKVIKDRWSISVEDNERGFLRQFVGGYVVIAFFREDIDKK